jgi:hypothetical protein
MEELEETLRSSPKLLEEALAEVTGESKRKWAVLVIALLLGVAVLAVVIRLAIQRSAETTPAREPGTAATGSESQASETESSKMPAWREKRAQLARSGGAMRARVGRIGSRLNPRRHAHVEREPHEATP